MAGFVVSKAGWEPLLQEDYVKGKFGPPGKKPVKKGGRDFRGIDRKTGKKDSGPGPISAVRAAYARKPRG